MVPVLRIGSLSGRQPPGAQRLRVVVSGAEVRRIRPEIDIRALPDPEEQMIDPVAMLAAGAADGLFSGSAGVTGKINAHAERLAERRPDVAHWSLLLEGIDLGALQLLANMLACRPFDSAEIVTEEWVDGTLTQSDSLSYPSCATPREFDFVYDRPTKSRGDRGVRLTFAYEPDEVALDRVIASLDTWGNIIMAGAYAIDSEAGPVRVLPNSATLEEPRTVGVSLQVYSELNELMFSPVVNLARRIHALYAPLERLEIL